MYITLPDNADKVVTGKWASSWLFSVYIALHGWPFWPTFSEVMAQSHKVVTTMLHSCYKVSTM